MIANSNIVLSFDLDFTLVNNEEGIIASFVYALDKFGVPKVNKSEIVKMIGLPLSEMFQKVTTQDSDALVSAFREYYQAKGVYQVEFLPGVKDKLSELKENDFRLGIVTSKKEELAIRVVEILGISNLFDYVIGEGKNMKTKLDPQIVNHLKSKYSNHKFIVIGDHPKDRTLANNLGAAFVGVLTGTHSREELLKNAKTKSVIIDSVKNLTLSLIYSLL